MYLQFSYICLPHIVHWYLKNHILSLYKFTDKILMCCSSSLILKLFFVHRRPFFSYTNKSMELDYRSSHELFICYARWLSFAYRGFLKSRCDCKVFSWLCHLRVGGRLYKEFTSWRLNRSTRICTITLANQGLQLRSMGIKLLLASCLKVI